MKKIKAMTKTEDQNNPEPNKWLQMLVSFFASNTFTKILGMLIGGAANGSLILSAVTNGVTRLSRALGAEKAGYKFIYWVSFISSAAGIVYALIHLSKGNIDIATDVIDAMNLNDSTVVR